VRPVSKAYFALLEEETKMIEDEFLQIFISMMYGRRRHPQDEFPLGRHYTPSNSP
jgi:hypothetical protein